MVAAVIVIAICAVLGIVVLVSQQVLTSVCDEDELLVFVGRSHLQEDGTFQGYRLVYGPARSWRFPFLETVHRMRMDPMELHIGLTARDDNLGPFVAWADAVVRVSRDSQLIHHAIKRFVGIRREMVEPVVANHLKQAIYDGLAGLSVATLAEGDEELLEWLRESVGEKLAEMGFEWISLQFRSNRKTSRATPE